MFNDPSEAIRLFELESGMNVADLGCGAGSYSIPAAKAVRPDGVVYAVDVQKDLLSKLKNNLANEHISNIEVIWGDLEKIGGTKLRDFSADAVIVANVLFQVEDKKTFALEVKRILKTGGKLLVIDWTDSFGGLGPHSGSVFSSSQARVLFEENNFFLEREVSAGDHHYGLVFRSKKL
ncbi:MAG: hypothetical protein COV70_00335 [Parcubacteria group bacterium CG11_big_fil_rev_8_21_14_0_20_39_22]|nr:MAG: hypothetical protein COV70_00335 [Parcubacteria group bacterium CG11_big_fil_rev_8_21_14_0_20_39_22]